ncbi:EAL domain-containing protein [Salinicola rhizosphaerae]|uniref:cyclic-guanylate-specific phosphodiesterase n=1 Tax=Salinicola rhizosphaerae TaxID=1443141 RepID=A0ABQ3ECF6_9GAMM|nr:EAL domain-containing protein [Salinicola rhizosphaerae]GHB33110.1 cyclic diguanylate phosphodiesterase [Salinicola rhizosphaerae]
MPLPQLRRRRRPFHALLPWLAALIPLLLGLPFLYWQASQTLKRQAQDNVDETLTKIEQIFDYAHTATESVASWVGARCEDAVLPLRQRSMATPYVRSLNLVQNGTIYCTSLRGDTHEQEQLTTYTGGTLRLMIGNRVTPARAVLILRHATPAGSVLAGIDSQYLSNALQLASQPVPLTLRIGETRLSANGTTSRVRPRDASSLLAVETSSHYPFSITAALPANGAWHFIWRHFTPTFVLIVALGGICGLATNRLRQRRNSPLREMRRALREGEFRPFYQPIVDHGARRWKGVEVLMRWDHPSEGMIPPDQFVPLAERGGLIVEMTRELMQQVGRELTPHVEALPSDFHIGINVSAEHCNGSALIDDCRDFLSRFPGGQIALVLELTERELLVRSEHTDHLFAQLHQLGVRIALDDFGTGNASLAYLRQFRVDYLKIDRSFVQMTDDDALSQHLLDTILTLSSRLELDTVAEGVETTAQRDYLTRHGVRYLQGFLYARPMPLANLLETLAHPPAADIPEHATHEPA